MANRFLQKSLLLLTLLLVVEAQAAELAVAHLSAHRLELQPVPVLALVPSLALALLRDTESTPTQSADHRHEVHSIRPARLALGTGAVVVDALGAASSGQSVEEVVVSATLAWASAVGACTARHRST